ncbi:MAG: hypothetical protein R3F43_13685 [bacterium]
MDAQGQTAVVEIWTLGPRPGRSGPVVPGNGARVSRLEFAPDGRTIALASGVGFMAQVSLWDARRWPALADRERRARGAARAAVLGGRPAPPILAPRTRAWPTTFGCSDHEVDRAAHPARRLRARRRADPAVTPAWTPARRRTASSRRPIGAARHGVRRRAAAAACPRVEPGGPHRGLRGGRRVHPGRWHGDRVLRPGGQCIFACNFRDPCRCGVDRVTAEGVFCTDCREARRLWGRGLRSRREPPDLRRRLRRDVRRGQRALHRQRPPGVRETAAGAPWTAVGISSASSAPWATRSPPSARPASAPVAATSPGSGGWRCPSPATA